MGNINAAGTIPCQRVFRSMKKEQEIFNELAALCTSPGYIHAIAYPCFRDTLVRYDDEMTTSGMKHLFSAEHLVRTELSTLIGLLIKEDINYTLPTATTTEKYISQTEELLLELHKAISLETIPGLGVKEIIADNGNSFNTGSVA
jgi:hypothetical protein